MTDKQPAQFDWATELSDAQGHVTLSEQEAKEIGARLRSMGAKLKAHEDLGDAADDVQLLRMGYAAAPPTAQAEGWRLVPVEPTPEMVHAYSLGEPRVLPAYVGAKEKADAAIVKRWKAMLAAAPTSAEGVEHG